VTHLEPRHPGHDDHLRLIASAEARVRRDWPARRESGAHTDGEAAALIAVKTPSPTLARPRLIRSQAHSAGGYAPDRCAPDRSRARGHHTF